MGVLRKSGPKRSWIMDKIALVAIIIRARDSNPRSRPIPNRTLLACLGLKSQITTYSEQNTIGVLGTQIPDHDRFRTEHYWQSIISQFSNTNFINTPLPNCLIITPYLQTLRKSQMPLNNNAAQQMDTELIKVYHTYGSYRDLAKYIVNRKDLDLWSKVLTRKGNAGTEYPQHRQLIDQIVECALPESTDADEVSCTVKAFMAADLYCELIMLLERFVLRGSDFSDNKNLQNLLILTAIRADPERVSGYIDRLDNFDAKDIALICVSESHMLYEEGYSIYVKFSKPEHTQDKDEQAELQCLAIGVLIDCMKDLDRAKTYAIQCDEKAVWSRLGKAQLKESFNADAIESFIDADDPSEYVQDCEDRSKPQM
ncbi:Clathrin protein [Fragilaria crotonensis]|nr:Clathrin protein [Fragilaria crotonensis]